MDRQAFKQRMQNLKSYRENNPGKGYWDWKVEAFADGGVNDNLIGSYSNHTGTPTMYVPVTKEYEATPDGFGEIANVHTPEVVVTPQNNISLAEAVDKGRRDAAPYVGAIVAGATLPAMSSTNMLGKAIDLANIVLDPTNPANYVKTYTKQLQNYAKSKNSPDLMQIGIKPMGANGSFDPNIPDYVFINSDYVKNGKLQPGLISHEKSHYDNQKAGALSLPIFDNRFVDTKKTKTMYPKTYDWIQRYLHNFEETKSHMNEFRTNMINKNLLKPDSKVGLKQIKDLIFNSDNDNMKKLFNTYKSKRQFVKDFNSVPITSIGDNKTLV